MVKIKDKDYEKRVEDTRTNRKKLEDDSKVANISLTELYRIREKERDKQIIEDFNEVGFGSIDDLDLGEIRDILGPKPPVED